MLVSTLRSIQHGQPANCSLMQPFRETLIPFFLLASGDELEKRAREIVDALSGRDAYLQSWPRKFCRLRQRTCGRLIKDRSRMSRTAVVIYNLGGPDSPEAVRPFLKTCFRIDDLAGAGRSGGFCLVSSWRRTPVAQEIYAEIEGKITYFAGEQESGEQLSKSAGRRI